MGSSSKIENSPEINQKTWNLEHGTLDPMELPADKAGHQVVLTLLLGFLGSRSVCPWPRAQDYTNPTGILVALQADLDDHSKGYREEHAHGTQNPSPKDQR